MDNQKLLPSAKSSSAIVRRASGGNFIEKLKSVETNKNDNQEKSSDSYNLVEEVKVIKDRVEEIKSILNNTISIQQDQREIIRKQEEQDRRQKKENELEKREKKPKKDNKLPGVPKMGILDRINRFITFTLLGFFAVRLIKHLPKILEFIKKISPVISFIETLAGAFFEGVVNFIDAGYKAYDTVREFTKKIGGEGFQKEFDDFSSKLNLFANLAIIAGMAAIGNDFGKGKKGNKPSVDRRGFSRDGRRVSKSAQTRYARRYGRDKFIQKFGKKNLKNLPKSIQRNAVQKLARNSAVKLFGKGGTKVVLKFVKPFLKRIPLIGGLIDFGLSVALGESPGKAAFKAIGATVLGVIGTGFGGPIGAIIGGFAGDWAGGKLYDIFFNNKKNVDDKTKVTKKRTRGKIPPRRKGSTIGRSIKRKIRRNITPPKPKQPKIGASVGGENKFKKLFPEPPKNKKSDTMSPFGVIKFTSDKLSEVPFIGPLFNIFGKTILGDMPGKDDYRIVGKAFNTWINSGLERGNLIGNIARAFAEGGAIQVEREMKQDISKWVEKSLDELIKNKVTEAINQFRKNLGLKPLQSGESGESGGGQTPSGGDGLGLAVTSDSPDFWLLATACLFENSDPQGAADVAQAIYNRVAMPGDPWRVQNSIRKTILNPNQFQPVRDYGGASVWGGINTKEDALRVATTYRKTAEQLDAVSAAILDKQRQSSARTFVGPRDSFRSTGYEDANNHLADDTEVRRHGHVFGFEPRGATIGMFRKGQLSAANVDEHVVGDVTSSGASQYGGDGKFIQGNSGNSGGIHYHIGPGSYQGGNLKDPKFNADAREAAFKVVKHFLGKKSMYHGRSGVFYSGKESDSQIRSMVNREQVVHTSGGRGSQGGIDLQVGGAYWPGAKVPFPLKTEGLKYRPGGFGVTAKISGLNAFVAHGAYDEKGKLAPQERGVNLYEGGGLVNENKKDISSIKNYPSYHNEPDIIILPLEIINKKVIPSPKSSNVNSLPFVASNNDIKPTNYSKFELYR
jgi:hypothetical protein